MVWPNALARHLQPQAIQASARAQISAITDSTGHVEVFQMDGVAISIIGRPRPLPGHDTPNPTQQHLHPQMRRATKLRSVIDGSLVAVKSISGEEEGIVVSHEYLLDR